MRPPFLFIPNQDAGRVLTPEIANRLVEKSFRLLNKAGTQVQMPPKIYLHLPRGDFRAMPAYASLAEGAACGIKWISVFPDNARKKLPTVIGTLLLNDPKTGKLLAVIEADTLTALRTGAAGAVASKQLARRESSTLSLAGAGRQALYQLLCHLSFFQFRKVFVWSPDPGEITSFIKRNSKLCLVLEGERDLKRCVEEADILCTCTPSRKPLIDASWVGEGTHINAIGADAPGKQELDEKLLLKSSIFVDDWNQASHSGEINVPFSKGALSKSDIKDTLTHALINNYRRKPREITLFDSTGLAIQDMVVADYIYKQILINIKGRRTSKVSRE